MPLFTTNFQEKVGLPPGTLIHVGEKRADKCKITLISYDEKHLEERELDNIEESFPYKDKPGITWINIDSVHQSGIIEAIGSSYGIHPLVLEDIVNTTHRPKMEDLDDYLFIVLKMLYYEENENEITAEQVSLIIGSNFVISFQEKEGDTFDPIRKRIRGNNGRIRKKGADYLAYSLMDTIVDNYFVILEKIGEQIEDIEEEELLENPASQTVHVIHSLKREMIMLRRSVWPLREVTGVLERGESKLIHKSTQIYLRDIYDHTVQVIDSIESSREMLSGLLDIYLSSMSNRMNRVMKVLTIFATIFMPLTFIAGIYGMNFADMPELKWKFGYPAVLLLMLAAGISMIIYFRKKKWL
ncbi:MAG: magnesium/cobalt transporter CorA [Spirochaetia bacterium]|nr:magnesium/cobalt transporter CorA [Spirochaetia bacterium]